MPYSDPLADGPVIHAAGTRGARGRRQHRRRARGRARARRRACRWCSCATPTWSSPRARTRSSSAWRAAGACGLIVPDLPQGEAARGAPGVRRRTASRWCRSSRRRPRPSGWRRSARGAQGFLYTVSVVGHHRRARGARGALRRDHRRGRRPCTDVPVALGFGISTPEQAREAADRRRRRGDRRHAPRARGGASRRTRRRRSGRSWANWRRGWRPTPDRMPRRMGLILTVTAGFVVWIVLWALGAKGFDAFLLATVIDPGRGLAEDPLRLPARPSQLSASCSAPGWA